MTYSEYQPRRAKIEPDVSLLALAETRASKAEATLRQIEEVARASVDGNTGPLNPHWLIQLIRERR